MYPSATRRGCDNSGIAVIARFGKRYFVANQMKRVQRGGSAASTFDSLAQVWGRPQCGFHISAPNGLPAETWQGQEVHAKTHARRAADSVPRIPRLCVSSYAVGIAIKKRTSPK